MGVSASAKHSLDELVRDLDLLVFRLEREAPGDRDTLARERSRVRREVEELRDRLDWVVREL